MHGAQQLSGTRQEDNDAPADVTGTIVSTKKKKLPLDIVDPSSVVLFECA